MIDNKMKQLIREACVETLAQAIIAEKNGADRIELCARLDLGGTTPSQDLIESCLATLTIPIKVMIRPRGGDFIYTQEEQESMRASIDMCRSLGVPEIVTGALTEDLTIDVIAMRSLSANVGDMPITFHKAIDEVIDIKSAIDQLKEIPMVKYILSSGQAETAEQGIEMLKEMISCGGDKITIIAAGKVTDANIKHLHERLQANEYHGKLIVGSLK